MSTFHDPIAAMQQALAGMKDIARIVRAYYAALVAEGFNEAHAVELTKAYQAEVIQGVLADDEL